MKKWVVGFLVFGWIVMGASSSFATPISYTFNGTAILDDPNEVFGVGKTKTLTFAGGMDYDPAKVNMPGTAGTFLNFSITFDSSLQYFKGEAHNQNPWEEAAPGFSDFAEGIHDPFLDPNIHPGPIGLNFLVQLPPVPMAVQNLNPGANLIDSSPATVAFHMSHYPKGNLTIKGNMTTLRRVIPTVVPEPSTVLLISLGLLAGVGLRRIRKV